MLKMFECQYVCYINLREVMSRHVTSRIYLLRYGKQDITSTKPSLHSVIFQNMRYSSWISVNTTGWWSDIQWLQVLLRLPNLTVRKIICFLLIAEILFQPKTLTKMLTYRPTDGHRYSIDLNFLWNPGNVNRMTIVNTYTWHRHTK